MATLREVARLAGVSVTTASRVLNDTDRDHPVSDATRAAVTTAAETAGYRRSAAARALKNGRSRLIGVIASDVLDPYFAEMTRGIEVAAAAAGYVTVLANANRDPYQERSRFQVLREHGAAGIVFCGSDIDGAPGTAELAREVNHAMRDGTDVISLAPRGFAATEIVIDNEASSYDLTTHLLDLGNRQIAFVGGLPGLVAAEMRISGYRRAMYNQDRLPRVAGLDGMSQISGRAATERLLASATRPDAIICTNDETAIGALAAIWQAGLRIPEDIAIAGIGGTDTGRVFDLTSIELPLAELGRLAVECIVTHSTPVPPEYRLRLGRTTAPRNPIA
ncbi:LacI family DNA-binding transcriptional regulator [Microbacterium saperdae]|uniref:LacI family transcriptional regulator n=1 Tax=Microbacterium saperdae TaxID=69368 RepID=A0A543BLA0_9MICO|nr:LacI family DNA-binding transcriptional regulator [Microbacterium saperdae]TQL85615.1 LacI family transcriptional regulator [Microbacterium saperdae]GGM62214.1 LacI family transcriptional regulator [Microbacterium saperdae]